MPRLGVNIDHIATLRQARRIDYPDPFEAIPILVKNRVDQVTIHLREDRRHIQDHDLERIIQVHSLPVNLEMGLTDEMIEIALKHKPATVTLVPEKREEVTTEGGLNLETNWGKIRHEVPRLKKAGIRVSYFIDPELRQVDLASELHGDAIELHTGSFCEEFGRPGEETQWKRLREATDRAVSKGLKVYAGHGLNVANLPPVVKIKEIEEYNIGHSIIARAVFVGLERAIQEIQEILK